MSNQKIGFSSCSMLSMITVKVFAEPNSRNLWENQTVQRSLVASVTIPVGALPWDSQGHVPSVFFDLDLEPWAYHRALCLGAGPLAAGNEKSEIPRLHLQGKFSKVLSVVPLYSKCTRSLIFFEFFFQKICFTSVDSLETQRQPAALSRNPKATCSCGAQGMRA